MRSTIRFSSLVSVAPFALISLATLTSCDSSSPSSSATPQIPATRKYNGTASVGDFLTVTVDSSAHTITYANASNGQSGTIAYTVNANGSYTLNDPTGNLLAAYEIPNYAMVIQAAKVGPDQATPALITAVESTQITLSTFEGNAYNYTQFRTTAGGVNIGSVAISAQGAATTSDYWPYGALTATNGGQSALNSNTMQLSAAQAGASGTYLTVSGGGGDTSTVFGTTNGIFAVDSPNGAILGLQKASSKDFDASTAGSYTAIYYQKTGASTGAGNIETGNPSLGNATVVVSAMGDVTITDSSGTIMAQGTVTAVADTAYLTGAGDLNDPCYGLFTFRNSSGGVQQDVFVAFQGHAAIFSSFSAQTPSVAGETYDYFYGVGLM